MFYRRKPFVIDEKFADQTTLQPSKATANIHFKRKAKQNSTANQSTEHARQLIR